MFTKILVAADGSPITRKVLNAASEISGMSGGELHLIYVIETGWSEGDLARELVIKEMEEESEAITMEMKKSLAATGKDVNVHIKRGHPGNTIINTAEEIEADLIIIGSVGRSQIERMMAGSVSTYVVTHSRMPTLVIKP